jgi:4-hydroxymandelate oxidase
MIRKTTAGDAGVGDSMRGLKFRGVSRRAVLGGLAALPALAGRSLAADVLPPSRSFLRPVPPVTAANQVLDVMQFEGLAREALPPAHFGYLATGNDDDRTVARNHDAFSRYEIRARRFVDVSHVDTVRNVYGTDWPTPVYLSAVSSQRAFHPDAEIGTARAARTRSTLMMLSNVGSTPVEPVIEARGAPVWQQLYATDDWRVTEAVVKRAERAGCTAIVLTVDSMPARNSETLVRAMQADSRVCTQCHINNSHDQLDKPMFAGLDMSNVHELPPPG